MIRSFRHKGLQRFFETGSKSGIQAEHAARLHLQLARLDSAAMAVDMNLPGWRFHQLAGNLKGQYAVTVSKNWRLLFSFENGDALLVDYRDYH
jgi:proteic killer suppression protein